MSEQVQFILSLKDLMSAGLQKMQGVASSVFGKIDKDVAQTAKNIQTEYKNAFDKMWQNATQAANKIQRELGKPVKLKVDTSELRNAQQDAGRSGFSFGKMFGANFLAGLAMQGARKIGELGMGALEQGMEVERNIVGLSTFVGDDRAKQIYRQLQAQAVYTPFTSQQLLGVERGILPYKSSTEANAATMALANAVAATGGSDFTLQRMGWHMQQMAASGQMQGMQAREFGIAGIPIYRLLANAFFPDMETNKAQEKLKNMTITYDMVTKALEKAADKGGMFAGAMEKLSQTIYGKWTTIKDFGQIGEANLTLSQADNIKDIEDVIIAAEQKVPEMVGEIAPAISGALKEVKELIPYIKTVVHSQLDALKPIVGLLISDPFKELLKSVLSLSASLTTSVIPVLDGLSIVVQKLLPIVTYVTDSIGKVVSGFNSVWEMAMQRMDERLNPQVKMTDADRTKLWYSPLGIGGSAQPFGILNPNYDPSAGAKGFANTGAGADINGALNDKADRITSGGKGPIVININRSPFEIHEMNVKNEGGTLGGVDDVERRFTEWFWRMVGGLNMAQG